MIDNISFTTYLLFIKFSLFNVISNIYAGNNLLAHYADEMTLIFALNRPLEPQNKIVMSLKLKQLFALCGNGAYSSALTKIDYTKTPCSLCHLLAREFGAEMLKYMPTRYSFYLKMHHKIISAFDLVNLAGETPLHWSCASENVSTFRYILGKRPDLWSKKNILSKVCNFYIIKYTYSIFKRPVDTVSRHFKQQLVCIYKEVTARDVNFEKLKARSSKP